LSFFFQLIFVFYIVAALDCTGYTHGWTWKKDAGKRETSHLSNSNRVSKWSVSNFWIRGIDEAALIKRLVSFIDFQISVIIYLGVSHFAPPDTYLLFFCFRNLQQAPLTRNGIGVAGQDRAEDMTRRGQRETGIWDGDING
jgi:hypothetical protein